MQVIEIAKFLNILSPVTLTVSLVMGVILYSKIDKLHKDLMLYMFLMLSIEICSRILGLWGNNLIILPLYSFIELSFFVYFYNKYLFTKPNKILIGLGVAGAIYIIAEILLYFVFNTLNVKQFQPYAKVLDNFIIVLLALFFFKEKAINFKESGWGNFRLNTVLLLFFTLTTIIFLPFNFLINAASEVKFYFWMFNVIMLVMFYIFLAVEVWKNSKVNK